MDVLGEKSRLALLLDRFGAVADDRQSWRVAYPLKEVLFLAVCGTMADCDDFENIVAWGEAHLDFLRRFSPFHHGVPCGLLDGGLDEPHRRGPVLRLLLGLGGGGLSRSTRPGGHRRQERAPKSRPRHRAPTAATKVSAFATKSRLVLGQEAVEDKSNEIGAIPALLERLDLKGALVSVDAMGCNPATAEAIAAAGADYLLAVKANQPILHAELEAYFETAPPDELDSFTSLDKSRGRIERRTCTVSRTADWLNSARAYPRAPRFPRLAAVARVEAVVEHKGRTTTERRYYICSRPLDAKTCADAVQSHWAIENSLHWTLDVTFKEDASRIRTGFGPLNMAVVRRFAFNLLRTLGDRHSLKTRRKLAGWNTEYLLSALQSPAR